MGWRSPENEGLLCLLALRGAGETGERAHCEGKGREEEEEEEMKIN